MADKNLEQGQQLNYTDRTMYRDMGTHYAIEHAVTVGANAAALPVRTRAGNKVDVALQDQTSRNFAWRFKQLQNLVTLEAPATVNNRNLTLGVGHNFTTDHWIAIIENGIPYQSKCTSIAGDPVIEFAAPLSYPYTVHATAARTSIEMAVNGSVTPQVFNINPIGNVKWDITHVIFVLVAAGSMDDSLFGDQAALANGVIVRKDFDTRYFNIFEARTNGDFRISYGQASYTQKVGGGNFSFVSDHMFGGQGGFGTVIRLDGNNNEELQVVIQDDLTTLTSFTAAAIGHRVED